MSLERPGVALACNVSCRTTDSVLHAGCGDPGLVETWDKSDMTTDIPLPRTPEAIFEDWSQRRFGLLKALTEDVDEFFKAADPSKENLCLYGQSDGTWSVDMPADEVPPELPEPCLGINFARDGMDQKDWLALVAVHSDSWLLSVAFFYGVKLDAQGRMQLFRMINQHPTLFEVVTGRTKKNSMSGAGYGRAGRPTHMLAGPEPNPSGRLITAADIGPRLKGQQGQLWWPDDAMWYPIQVLGVNLKTHMARIHYSTGEEEEVDLDEMVREQHMTLLGE